MKGEPVEAGNWSGTVENVDYFPLSICTLHLVPLLIFSGRKCSFFASNRNFSGHVWWWWWWWWWWCGGGGGGVWCVCVCECGV